LCDKNIIINDTSHLAEGIAQAATCKNIEEKKRVKRNWMK
jgi:hypothetical protein